MKIVNIADGIYSYQVQECLSRGTLSRPRTSPKGTCSKAEKSQGKTSEPILLRSKGMKAFAKKILQQKKISSEDNDMMNSFVPLDVERVTMTHTEHSSIPSSSSMPRKPSFLEELTMKRHAKKGSQNITRESLPEGKGPVSFLAELKTRLNR